MARTHSTSWEGRWSRVVSTTPWRVTSDTIGRAMRAAAWFSCPYVPRNKRNLADLAAAEQADYMLVADIPLKLYSGPNWDKPVFFHPSMAQPRLSQMRCGTADRLVRVAELRQGDTVLDATFGLGTDALVMAEAVGESGHVVACEASPLLARLFTFAAQEDRELYPAIRHLWDRIQVAPGDHLDLLRSLPADSVDVVYFDPMFRRPVRADSANIENIRHLVNPAPLSTAAWTEAMRVARRAVVLKERPGAGEFERFGVIPDKPRGKFAFGVWRKESGHGGREDSGAVYRGADSRGQE